VAVPLHVYQTFTYRLSGEVSTQAVPGARIMVQLGRKLVTGYIVALFDELPSNLAELDIKDAQDLVDLEPVCTPEILQLARWVADYYACPLGEVIKAALPPGMTPSTKRGRAFVKPKLRRFVRLIGSQEQKLTVAQERVVKTLEQSGPMSLQSLCELAGAGASTVSSLAQKGLVEIYDEAVRRDPLAHASTLPAQKLTLTAQQHPVLEKIEEQIARGTYGAFLLHGVTGSGKTEVYIRAMRSALKLDRSAMMLVPEIALTPVFSHRLRAEFGDLVAIFRDRNAIGRVCPGAEPRLDRRRRGTRIELPATGVALLQRA
jgi:primosomal protein N' (replication factor Y)